MVENPETLTEIDLYRNPETGKLVGRDPVSGDLFPVPIEAAQLDEATVATAPETEQDVARLADIPDSTGGLATGPIGERPSSGSVDDELYYATDQRTLWRWDADASDWVAGGGLGTESDPLPEQHVGSLAADGVDITGETFIRAIRNSSTSTQTAGNFISVYDSASKDVRGEFSGGQITVDESGEYEISGSLRLSGASAGDQVTLRVRDCDSASDANDQVDQREIPSSNPWLTFSFDAELSSTQTYEVQVADNTSSYSVEGVGEGVIKPSVVHD